MKLNQIKLYLVIIKISRSNNLPLFDDGKHLFEFYQIYLAGIETNTEFNN